MRQVQEEMFVNFAVRLFLESQESEMKKFLWELEGRDLADEKCTLMEEYLEIFSEAIQENSSWFCKSS